METQLSGLDRRAFLAASGLSALLGSQATAQARRLVPRTLFFNLAHEHITNRPHFLFTNGAFYRLTRTIFDPSVLANARLTNMFLRRVPDSQITHHIERVMMADDISTLGYVGTNENLNTGTWSMSMIVQYLPPSAMNVAYARARMRRPLGPLALSAKRFQYGHLPATTLRDFQEEQDLVDSTDHARTLIGLHPDLLCADPGGANHIHTNYISSNSKTRFLAAILTQKGPADPQQNAGQPNSRGWATMLPINQDNGTPFKNSASLNQYYPDWDSTVEQQVVGAVVEIHPQVKDDQTLGADVTTPPAGPSAGKVWYRSDGQSFVARTPNTLTDASGLVWDFKDQNGSAGLKVTQPSVNPNPGGPVQVTLNNVNNWFLRFLGMWLQFVDPNGNVIPVSQLPSNTIPARKNQPNPLDKADTLFAGIVPPPFSVAGIPVAPGAYVVSLNMPPDARTLRVYYAGIGYSGSRSGPDGINAVGTGLTIAVNYGLVAFFMAVGVSTIDPVVKLLTSILGQVVAQEVITAITVEGLDNGTVNISQSGLAFIKGVLNGLAGKGLATLMQEIAKLMAAAEIIDSVPVAGQIARAAAAIIGGVQLAETSIELAVSPAVYEYDLVLTHDIQVTILPDVNNNQFPQEPGYTLYYKISYLFDNASAHVMDAVDVPDPTVKSIVVTLPGLPFGGKVNVMVGFYTRKSSTPAGQNDWCAGNGSTGLVDNTQNTPLTITIRQVKMPINSATQYIHTRKTSLNSSSGHVWLNTSSPPPYVPPSGSQQPGSLGAFRSITVRQGTRTQQGYVGYSWQAYSRTLNDCIAGSPGQLDQAANLNTDASNGGVNAQNGYATTSCGLQGGATSGLRLAYSLINDDAANYYLDTSSLLVRPVQLNPPSFSSPTQGLSVAQLNLDSTRLLLHPAGHLVSINNANHKLETAKLPAAPVADPDAKATLVARTYAGQGARPGLMTSPVAAAISPEGIILVLEDATVNNRLQAFDVGGNPIQYFKGQTNPYFLQLAATPGVTYLDVAIEYTGYIYVLSQSADGATFRLDIYHPSQTDTNPISTTMGVTASKLTVDFWRSVYTLNYEVLQLPSGAIPDITEPSVSLWMPSGSS